MEFKHSMQVTHNARRFILIRVEKIEGKEEGRGIVKGTKLFDGHSSCFFQERQAGYAVHCIATC